MTITTTIFIVAGALAVFITAMHFANLFLPYDPITPGKSIYVNLYKEYTSLKSRELEELPRFVVMIWQPFMLLRSASLCLFRITLCMQRYDFVSYKTKVS